MLSIFAALSELERDTLLVRQREGIEAARARGKQFGRPRVEIPENFDAVCKRWKAGDISAVRAMSELGLSKPTFYRLVKRQAESEK